MAHTGVCPRCGSRRVDTQIYQEQAGSKTKTKTKFKFKEKGHGILWWICVGWWWVPLDLLLWCVLFFPRLVLRLFAAPFKHKKYRGSSKSIAKTKNNYRYKTVFVCKNCGKTWSSTAK